MIQDARIAPISVLLVEDDDFLRAATADALKRYRINVVGAVSTSAEAIELAKKIKLDVAVLDINLGGGPTGIDLAYGLRKINDRVGLVFLTAYSDPRFAGTKGLELPEHSAYIVKKNISKIEVVAEAITAAYKHARDIRLPLTTIKQQKAEDLTDLQVELMRMIHIGMSNSQIASNRKTTVKSTETAISRLAKKLDINASSETSQRVRIAQYYADMRNR